ncbi:1-aminocyclopropane-1-carboxylate deaminase [Tenacibaculum sp. MAR_2009_124]|uniref:1-aminocyclopropane-1-carboxylate deaminase/D-cysteine desulfhydrase n=1 Tax=Tenacibaculum sp. MAR_2009_124 TaxID=1250059 RepID=UPI00089887FA|nr:pyridoxal-phosphate dependent enzyme [Tenacibaculum sp. MAR_2009_124]SED07264.1 1-aminocyclopropane-1-carboxylate deaminase [Tenacibaculum sp. MAR_2009_124]
MFNLNTYNQQINLPILDEKEIGLFIKREDLIHPSISGNKYRKLKYNLLEAKRLKLEIILTFGGAYSNHIAATAAAGKIGGFKTIGIIRGDELANDLDNVLENNKTLKFANSQGMDFKFVSREDYRNKKEEVFLKKLKEEYGNFYLIPEGGTNELAVKGCQEILTAEDEKFDYICSAVGTGGTIAGLINATTKAQKVIGFPALKGNFLEGEIRKFSKENNFWHLENEYHFGGYGKFNEELISFINSFKEKTTIPLDPIYTGKMVYGIINMVSNDKFQRGSKILIIHTGGLQGIEGINQKLKRRNMDLIQ